MKNIFLYVTILSTLITTTICMELYVKNEDTEIWVERVFQKGCDIVKKDSNENDSFVFSYFFKDNKPIQSLQLSADKRFLFLIRSCSLETIHLSTKTFKQMIEKKRSKQKKDMPVDSEDKPGDSNKKNKQESVALKVSWGVVKKSISKEFSSPIKNVVQDSDDGITVFEENGTKSFIKFDEI